MTFDERVSYFLLGVLVGFVLAKLTQLVRGMKELKKELDEVEDHVNQGFDFPKRNRDEKGFMRNPFIADVAVLLVVGLTAYASFVSQKASNDVQDAQHRIDDTVYCTKHVLVEALGVLNNGTPYTKQQIAANVKLQQDFSTFFDLLLHQPPYPLAKQRAAAERYKASQHHFLVVSKERNKQVTRNPFPSNEAMDNCLRDRGETIK